MASKKLCLCVLGGLSSFLWAKPPIDPNNLTDNQRRSSQNFTHEKKQKRLISEGCLAGANPSLGEKELKELSQIIGSEDISPHQRKMISRGNDLCSGRMEAQAFGLGEPVVKMASKMWSLVMGVGGGRGMAMKNLGNEAHEEVEQGENKQTDFCRYIPVGTEAVAAFQQRSTNNHIINSVHPKSDAQYATIMKAARMYDSRSDNTKALAVGWGLTTGCYTALMARSGVELNPAKGWKNYLKLGASAFMTLYYTKMIGIHGNRASLMRKIAESLPKKGDCNPITDKNCYCMEETTKNDPKHCMPFAHKKKVPPLQKKVAKRQACIDNQAKEDADCLCMAQKNCLDDGFEVVFQNGSLPGLSGTPFTSDLKGLSRGHVDTGKLSGLARAKKYATRGIRFLKDNVKEVPDDAPLSPGEKRQVRLLKNTGLPNLISRGLALHTPSAGEQWKAQGFGVGTMPARKSSRYKRDGASAGRVLRYEGGEGLAPKKTRKSRGNDFNPYTKLLSGKRASKGRNQRGKTLSFAEKAHREAQVHRSPDVSLFALISRRYRAIDLRPRTY